MEEQPLISYQHVNVSLQGQEILSDVNLELRKGEFVYLIGKVGSGKSTLLKTIYGEVEIDDGEAWVLGNAMRSLKQKDIPYPSPETRYCVSGLSAIDRPYRAREPEIRA